MTKQLKIKIGLFSILVVMLTITLLVWQKNKNNITLQEKVANFIASSNGVVIFGNANIDNILKLSEYDQNPLINALVKGSIEPFSNALDLKNNIYYAIEDNWSEKERYTARNYIFAEVKNKDSLQAILTKKGFQLEDTLSLSYVENEYFHLAFDNYSAVIIPQQENREDVIATFVEIFEAMSNNNKNSEIASILNKRQDFVIGYHIYNLYNSAEDAFIIESEENKEKLQQLLKNNFVEMGFAFEKGHLKIQVNNLFSKNMREVLFFNPPNTINTINYVACQEPIAGLSINVDSRKITELLEEYLPNTMETLNEEIDLPISLSTILTMLDGRIAYMSNSIEQPRVFIGMSKGAKEILYSFGFLLNLLFDDVTKLDDGILLGEHSSKLDEKAFKRDLNNKLGTHAIDLFINEEAIEDLPNEYTKYSYIVKSIEAHYDQKGGIIIVETKKEDENILKQILDQALQEFRF